MIRRKITLTVFRVYLPHYNGRIDQIGLYNEVLDVFQSKIDVIDTPTQVDRVRDE